MSATENAANLAMSGASAFLLSALGVEPGAIIWAIVGSVLGVALAPPMGRIYAIALFAAATLTCALIATGLSEWYFNGSPLARNIAAVALAALFHPVFKASIERVGDVVSAWIIRLSAMFGGTK